MKLTTNTIPRGWGKGTSPGTSGCGCRKRVGLEGNFLVIIWWYIKVIERGDWSIRGLVRLWRGLERRFSKIFWLWGIFLNTVPRLERLSWGRFANRRCAGREGGCRTGSALIGSAVFGV